MYVVPKGAQHRPLAERAHHVLLIEPRGVVNTGDAGGALQAENDLWNERRTVLRLRFGVL